MKIQKFALGLIPLFLTACAASTPTRVQIPVTELTKPTQIEGPVASRSQAKTNGELWDFAGQAEAAVVRANRDKELLDKFLSPKKCSFVDKYILRKECPNP